MIGVFDDLLDRFGPPDGGESDRQRALREGAGGLALHWLLALPESAARDAAIHTLADAMELACEACKT